MSHHPSHLDDSHPASALLCPVDCVCFPKLMPRNGLARCYKRPVGRQLAWRARGFHPTHYAQMPLMNY